MVPPDITLGMQGMVVIVATVGMVVTVATVAMVVMVATVAMVGTTTAGMVGMVEARRMRRGVSQALQCLPPIGLAG